MERKRNLFSSFLFGESGVVAKHVYVCGLLRRCHGGDSSLMSSRGEITEWGWGGTSSGFSVVAFCSPMSCHFPSDVLLQNKKNSFFMHSFVPSRPYSCALVLPIVLCALFLVNRGRF